MYTTWFARTPGHDPVVDRPGWSLNAASQFDRRPQSSRNDLVVNFDQGRNWKVIFAHDRCWRETKIYWAEQEDNFLNICENHVDVGLTVNMNHDPFWDWRRYPIFGDTQVSTHVGSSQPVEFQLWSFHHLNWNIKYVLPRQFWMSWLSLNSLQHHGITTHYLCCR